MSTFSFNTTAGASQSAAKSRLTGNDIYTVKFDGCEIVDIKGVKDPSMTYKVLKLKFSNEEGTFEHTIFEPKQSDFNRTETEFTKDGKTEKIPQASGVENMMLLFKHAIDAIAPKVGKQIDDGSKNLGAPNWEGLRLLVSQILDSGKGTETKIKLMINNKGEAQFPGFFSGVSREGKAYIRNNFMGEKLAFSTYELTRINNAATARPTPMANTARANTPIDITTTQNDPLDFSFEMPNL